MKIPANVVGRYHRQVSELSEQAGRKYEQIVRQIEDAWSSRDQESLVEQLVELADSITDMYGDAAATVAANLYAEIAELQGILLSSVPIANSINREHLRNRINQLIERNTVGAVIDWDGFRRDLVAMVKTAVKTQAGDTITENAGRDTRHKVKYARVPMGKETCAWCIMLASQGFVYASKKTAGEFRHFHDNCDCIIVPSFGEGSIEGYDESEYLDIYNGNKAHGSGDNTVGTLNNMRRFLYSDYKDKRNAMRRENRARRKRILDSQSD